jgi:hypothetical protein
MTITVDKLIDELGRATGRSGLGVIEQGILFGSGKSELTPGHDVDLVLVTGRRIAMSNGDVQQAFSRQVLGEVAGLDGLDFHIQVTTTTQLAESNNGWQSIAKAEGRTFFMKA